MPTYLHHDQLGSTSLLTDGSGESTGSNTYDPYGTFVATTGPASTPLGYAGQYTLGQSGLQYLRARVYDPGTGQFLARDPLQALTREPYAYAGDDPANFVDPGGEDFFGDVIGVVDAVVAAASAGDDGEATDAEGPENEVPRSERTAAGQETHRT